MIVIRVANSSKTCIWNQNIHNQYDMKIICFVFSVMDGIGWYWVVLDGMKWF